MFGRTAEAHGLTLMRLIEALNSIKKSAALSGAEPFRTALVCGFTPLHLQTFLHAELQLAYPLRPIEIRIGQYGDISGTLGAFAGESFDALSLFLEWSDLDPRLGTRQLGGWGPSHLNNVVEHATAVLSHIGNLLGAFRCPVAIVLPTLPLPPLFTPAGWEASTQELELRNAIAAFAAKAAGMPNVRIVSEQRLAEQSPSSQRFSAKSEWVAGFPYHVPHASAVAGLAASALRPYSPKKGLITDLDNTLWQGIIGDIGVSDICWDLDRKAHQHGFYQQMLSTLAEEGVLIAVASKNDPAIVAEAFERRDLLISNARIFPMEVSWGSKAAAVSRILEAWNISADSVVFVDDNPAELAEVQAAHPAIEPVLFRETDAQAVYDVVVRLRDLFGKRAVSAEDGLRLDSIRAAATFRENTTSSQGFSDALLEHADAELTLSFRKDAADARPFELINKTNQFNLNGKRVLEAEWRDWLAREDTFVLTATYKDRFGLLGKIAVLSGCKTDSHICVHHWVMSCRAFARRIEHQCMKLLFENMKTDRVIFDYIETPRNGPVREFLAAFGHPEPGFGVDERSFAASCPKLYHRVITEQ